MKKTFLIVAVVLLLVIISGVYTKIKMPTLALPSFSSSNETKLTQEEAKFKVIEFVEDNLVQPGTDVNAKGIVEENGMYKVTIEVGKQEVETYITKDGKKFFPQVMDIAKVEEDKKVAGESTAAPADVPKTDKPAVELFVMSYCPYGTQIEKGILPVLDTLKNKIDFKLRFVDYIMHDKKEADENLRQYCIQKEEPTKLNAYLTNFLKKGEGTEAASLAAANINSAKIQSCMTAADKQFKVTETFNEKSGGNYPAFNVDQETNDKYGVQGSPTLVINGVEAQSGRDPKNLLSTICSAFNNAPEECQKELSSASPSPGFGEGSGSNSAASCGN